MWIRIGFVLIVIVVSYVVLIFLSLILANLLCSIRNKLLEYVNDKNVKYGSFNFFAFLGACFLLYYYRDVITQELSELIPLTSNHVTYIAAALTLLAIAPIIFNAKLHAPIVIIVKALSIPLGLAIAFLCLVLAILQTGEDPSKDLDEDITLKAYMARERERKALEATYRPQTSASSFNQPIRPSVMKSIYVDGVEHIVYSSSPLSDTIQLDNGQTVHQVSDNNYTDPSTNTYDY